MMITCTPFDGEGDPIYLNAAHVVAVISNDHGSRVDMITERSYMVNETPVEVIQLIKLADPGAPVLQMLRDLLAIDGARELLVELVGQLMKDYAEGKAKREASGR